MAQFRRPAAAASAYSAPEDWRAQEEARLGRMPDPQFTVPRYVDAQGNEVDREAMGGGEAEGISREDARAYQGGFPFDPDWMAQAIMTDPEVLQAAQSGNNSAFEQAAKNSSRRHGVDPQYFKVGQRSDGRYVVQRTMPGQEKLLWGLTIGALGIGIGSLIAGEVAGGAAAGGGTALPSTTLPTLGVPEGIASGAGLPGAAGASGLSAGVGTGVGAADAAFNGGIIPTFAESVNVTAPTVAAGAVSPVETGLIASSAGPSFFSRAATPGRAASTSPAVSPHGMFGDLLPDLISYGGQALEGYLGSRSANKAAQDLIAANEANAAREADAFRQSMALQRGMYNNNVQLNAPYLSVGRGAARQLAAGMGLDYNEDVSQYMLPEEPAAPAGGGNTAVPRPGSGNTMQNLQGGRRPQSGPSTGLAGLITMRSPNGQTKQVPANEAQHWLSRGAQVVG